MKIIAVTNIKGGVGKTTTAVNLAYLCAASGGATLLWDLDPQGAATYTLRGEPLERASAKKLLSGNVMASTREQFPNILATEVPYSSEIERMSLRRAPIPAFAPNSAAARIYATLWAEITARLGEQSPAVARSD
jgi:cellulose biosynthesis protein BcsQ